MEHSTSTGIVHVDIDRVLVNKDYPGSFSKKRMLEEVERIRSMGALQPIFVMPSSGNRYVIITGEVIYHAAKAAGLRMVPVTLVDYSDEQIAQAILFEKLEREDLNFVEEAEVYNSLINDHGMNLEELSKQVGLAPATINTKIRLLKLSVDVRMKLKDSSLTEGHARALLKLDNDEFQTKALERIIEKEYTVKQAEEFINEVVSKGTIDVVEPKKPLRFVIKDNRIILSTLKKSIADVQKMVDVSIDMKEEQIGDNIVLTLTIPNKKK